MTGEAELTAVAVSEEVREWLPVATIADLRLMVPTATRFIEVLGYYAKGDGGGGRFYFDSASTSSDNGGTIIAPDAGGVGRWLRVDTSFVTPVMFGAKGDGSTDDTAKFTAMFAAGVDKYRSPPGKTYVVDGTALEWGDGIDLDFSFSTIKLKAQTLSANLKMLSNRNSTTYNVATARQSSGMSIRRLKIDGNSANVTAGSYGVTALQFHMADHILIDEVEIKDLPGTGGNGYGIIFWYCNDAHVRRTYINGTDRQNVAYWESTGSVTQCDLRKSAFREPVIVSSDNPISYQASRCEIHDNPLIDNSGTTSGTHVVRFSGNSNGSVKRNRIVGKSTTQGIYIVDTLEHNVTVEDNDIEDCEYGVLVESNGLKNVALLNNRTFDCVNGIRVNCTFSNGRLVVRDNVLDNTTTQPLYINAVERAEVHNNHIRGGATACFISVATSVKITGNYITAMTSASFSLNVGGTPTLKTVYAYNHLTGNTANVVNLNQAGFTLCNEGTFSGSGAIPTYSITNVTTDRAYDADTAVVAETNDALGTVINDLEALRIFN